jgi:glutathione S-transferase
LIVRSETASEYFDAKASGALGLDFPNLPYLFDGDIKLTQSNAILRHVARRIGIEVTS